MQVDLFFRAGVGEMFSSLGYRAGDGEFFFRPFGKIPWLFY